MVKAKYYVVENETHKTLGVFSSFAKAAAYRAANGLLWRAMIWGFDPETLRKK